MKSLNIILKSFDGALHRVIAEYAFRDLQVGKCISLTNFEKFTPNINAENMQWISTKNLRDGKYPDVDWTQIAPLDEELIEAMYGTEMQFLSMSERYAIHGDISYYERKRRYFEHLRFWSHTLDHDNINVLLMNHAPHHCYDIVLYGLCKLKNIPSYHLERCYSVEGALVVNDYEISDPNLLTTFNTLMKEYADPNRGIPLSESSNNFVEEQTLEKNISPIAHLTPEVDLLKRSFLHKWIKKTFSLLLRKPQVLLRAIASPVTWSRKIAQHKTTRYYDDHCKEPDLSKPYIYVPLHMQPEEAVSPRGGGYENQELVVQMLASHAPKGVQIYVKEHPMQGELYRNIAFYSELVQIPSVTLVPRKTDTFELIKHSRAVGTITGTAGFEALFRGKPVMMFGHRFYQYAPGIYRIHSSDDCRKAMESIFEKGETPPLRDLKVFLKAIEECSVPCEGSLEIKEHSKGVGIMLNKKLAPLFSN